MVSIFLLVAACTNSLKPENKYTKNTGKRFKFRQLRAVVDSASVFGLSRLIFACDRVTDGFKVGTSTNDA